MRLLFAALSQISVDVTITHKTVFDVRLDTLADITGQKEKVLYRRLSHVGDHVDDVFNLFRIDNLVRQVLRHFVVGDEALFLSPCD